MKDKRNRIIGGLTAAASGALTAIGPQTLFRICDQTHHMEGLSVCFWTARAEIGIGTLIALIGVAYIFFADRHARVGLSLGAAGAALLSLAVANFLIGVDDSPMMACRLATLPALNVVAVITVVLASANTVWLLRNDRDIDVRGGQNVRAELV
jgi:hypothetical protein